MRRSPSTSARYGLAWMSNGELIFSSNWNGCHQLWRVNTSGTSQPAVVAGIIDARSPAVSFAEGIGRSTRLPGLHGGLQHSLADTRCWRRMECIQGPVCGVHPCRAKPACVARRPPAGVCLRPIGMVRGLDVCVSRGHGLPAAHIIPAGVSRCARLVAGRPTDCL